MLLKIPENVGEDSGECLSGFRGMFKQIPRNLNFDLSISLFFINLAKSGHFRLLYLKLIFHTIGQNFS